MHGVCVLGGGYCSRNIDCEDDEVCTEDLCIAGVCTSTAVAEPNARCLTDDHTAGMCVKGKCEFDPSAFRCASDADCPATENPCRAHVCIAERCAPREQVNGTECYTDGGAVGACLDGMCRVETARLDTPEPICKRRWVRYRGWVGGCRTPSRQRLTPAELREEETRIQAALDKTVRYDMRAALVALPSGGYNIVLHNRRARTDLRGLCDPSFVAFTMADVTRNSSWKSRSLHVWLRPYEEGWRIATRGSRAAIDAGRRSSLLGQLGVVEVSTFRKWLEKEFRPLAPAPFDPAAMGGSPATSHTPPPAPPTVAATLPAPPTVAATLPAPPTVAATAPVPPTVATTAPVPPTVAATPPVPPTVAALAAVAASFAVPEPPTAAAVSTAAPSPTRRPPPRRRPAPASEAGDALPNPSEWEEEDAPARR